MAELLCFKRLLPTTGNYCPQWGQACDSFSQSQHVHGSAFIGNSWKIFPFLFFCWHQHLYILQNETVQRDKITPNIFFSWKGLVWFSELVYSPVSQEMVLAHQRVQDHCFCSGLHCFKQPQLRGWWLSTRARKVPSPCHAKKNGLTLALLKTG